jgi:chromatin remodeling complex protein RSC6
MSEAKANGLQRPMTPSPELAKVIGEGEVARSDAVKRLWDYIKAHKRQNPENKREILADEALRPLFHGKEKVTMFEMNAHLAKHLK